MNKILHTKAEVTKSEDDGVVEAVVASTAILDRQGDIIDQEGWDLTNFKKSPVILWGHNVREERPPIGKAEKVWLEGEGKKRKLMFKAKFDMQDTFAAEIFRKVKDGFLNMVSVGFLPTEWEPIKGEDDFFGGHKFVKQELLEISFVPVPANPQAAVQIRSLGRGIEPIEEDKLYPEKEEKIIPKGVIPFKSAETVPEATDWDGPGETAKATTEDLKQMCAWFNEESPDLKSSYKFPHHRAEDKKVVWRGVATAMALLLGANGGVKIPDEDRKGVYDHLSKHYKQYEKEAPEYRMVEEQVLKNLIEEVSALVLDREDKYIVRLLKKNLEATKEQKVEVKKQTITIDTLAKALVLVDKGLGKKLNGGEK